MGLRQGGCSRGSGPKVTPMAAEDDRITITALLETWAAAVRQEMST